MGEGIETPAAETRGVVIVGAGPAGVSCAVALRQAGLDALIIDKGSLTDALRRFPTNMVFFTTPDRLEIGGLPFICQGEKPTRQEALKYYRRVAESFGLDVRTYERVVRVSAEDGGFAIETRSVLTETPSRFRAHNVVLATGCYDQPNMLGVRGEELPHVSHYYSEAHAYGGRRVAVVGGGNSAAEAALDLFRNGASVTLVHRGAELSAGLKYWVAPDIRNRIEAGEIVGRLSTEVVEIQPSRLRLRHVETRVESELLSDFVLALTGYHADDDFLREAGVRIDPATRVPEHDTESFESNVAGLYLAGTIVAGGDYNRVFIENSRFHGERIAAAVGRSARGVGPT